MPVHVRRYFQLVEKNSAKVNPLWKVFHAFIFITIMVLSMTAVFTFHDLSDAFSYNCILYARPDLTVDNITYYVKPVEAVDIDTLDLRRRRRDVISDAVDDVNATTTTTPDINATTIATVNKTIPTEEKFEIIDHEYWIENATLKGRVIIDYRESVFGSRGTCNTVLFFPLLTLVLAAFAAIIVIICGRGGKGYPTDLFPQPWRYVYPFLILSLVMLIFNSIVVSWLSKGMQIFCASFKEVTGLTNCSEKINYFMDEAQFEVFNLYQSYRICLGALIGEAVMWGLQLLLIISRVMCAADFDLGVVKVSCNRRHSVQFDDPVNQFLSTFTEMKRVTLVTEHYYDDDDDDADDEVSQISEKRLFRRRKLGKKKVGFIDEPSDEESSTTILRQPSTESHKLNKAEFEDQKPPGSDDEDVTQV